MKLIESKSKETEAASLKQAHSRSETATSSYVKNERESGLLYWENESSGKSETKHGAENKITDSSNEAFMNSILQVTC